MPAEQWTAKGEYPPGWSPWLQTLCTKVKNFLCVPPLRKISGQTKHPSKRCDNVTHFYLLGRMAKPHVVETFACPSPFVGSGCFSPLYSIILRMFAVLICAKCINYRKSWWWWWWCCCWRCKPTCSYTMLCSDILGSHIHRTLTIECKILQNDIYLRKPHTFCIGKHWYAWGPRWEHSIIPSNLETAKASLLGDFMTWRGGLEPDPGFEICILPLSSQTPTIRHSSSPSFMSLWKARDHIPQPWEVSRVELMPRLESHEIMHSPALNLKLVGLICVTVHKMHH